MVRRTGRIVAGGVLAAIVVATASFSSHSAVAEDVTTPILMERSTVSIPYGEYWSFSGVLDDLDVAFHMDHRVSAEGGPAGYTPSVDLHNIRGEMNVFLYAPPGARVLDAGVHEFTITANWRFTPGNIDDESFNATGVTDPPLRLEIAPAAVATEVRIVTDPNNPANAIVSTRLTGTYIDNAYRGSAPEPEYFVTPAGSWTITVTNPEGDIALERSLDQAAAAQPYASFYWTEFDPETTYSALATFTPGAAESGNFAVSDSPTFSYTSPASPRPQPSATAPEAVAPVESSSNGLAIPLWATVLLGIVLAALATWTVLLSIRLHRLRARTEAPA